MTKRENVSDRLPRTEADADLLKPAIAKLLQTIPESWAEFNLDALTTIEDNALFLLTAAGMVERRGWLRSTIANHPTCFEVRFQATGEGGFDKAIEHATAVEYATWGDAWREWKAGETGHVSPFRTETMKPQEWRLTVDGVIARSELDGSNRVVGFDNALDFIFKRGFFGPGYWCRLAYSNPQRVDAAIIEEQTRLTGQDLASLSRPPLSGSGAVVELRKIDRPPEPQAVNLVNWQDGADAFAAAFAAKLGPAFEAMSKGQRSNGSPPAPSAPPPTGAPKQSEGNGGTGSTPKKTRSPKPADSTPKRGRPVDKTTIQRADFAKPLREQSKTWEEIAASYTRKYPRDIDASADTLRLAFQRQYPEPK